jgi:hypothetical protein
VDEGGVERSLAPCDVVGASCTETQYQALLKLPDFERCKLEQMKNQYQI